MEGELNSSILGSYEFWNNLYNEEIENFQNHGDVGEIWFGSETSKRIVKWISENERIKKSDSVLDLDLVLPAKSAVDILSRDDFSCGNGMLLVELSRVGFKNLNGVDYSQNAIDLASEIADREKCCINFFVGNILEDVFEMSYSVCLDKGTYDAISLDPEDAKLKRQTYIMNVNKILKEDGFFIMTSCNWTDAELIEHFKDLEVVETIPSPTFKFGGKTGKTVNTVVFKKR